MSKVVQAQGPSSCAAICFHQCIKQLQHSLSLRPPPMIMRWRLEKHKSSQLQLTGIVQHRQGSQKGSCCLLSGIPERGISKAVDDCCRPYPRGRKQALHCLLGGAANTVDGIFQGKPCNAPRQALNICGVAEGELLGGLHAAQVRGIAASTNAWQMHVLRRLSHH